MNHYEMDILKCQRRIKNIEQNPKPGQMKSNKLRYELELDLAKDQLEAWQAGKPFADGPSKPLLNAMGFHSLDLTFSADRSQLAQGHMDLVRGAGYPVDACDRTVVCIAMCLNREIPQPSLLVSSNHACDPIMLAFNAIGRSYKVPVFAVDIPLENNNVSLKYVTDQLGELIEFAQAKVPGIKYDESRLIELQEADKKAFAYMRQIYELRKMIPSPISGKDAFRLPRFPSRCPDQSKAIEYFRIWSEEIKDKAARGEGAVLNEKLRILWAVSGPFFANPFKVLEARGASTPWFQYDIASRWAAGKGGTYGDETEYGRKLTPLEEEARMISHHAWASVAKRWVDDTLDIAVDLHIDAIINFIQLGCTATANLSRLLEDEAEKRLNIHTLQIEGRQLDRSYFDEKDIETKLNVFVDRCLAQKASRSNAGSSGSLRVT